MSKFIPTNKKSFPTDKPKSQENPDINCYPTLMAIPAFLLVFSMGFKTGIQSF